MEEKVVPTPNSQSTQGLKLILIGCLTIIGLTVILLASLFAKNYYQPSKVSQKPVQIAQTSNFVSLQFKEEQDALILDKVVQTESHPTAIPLKPQDGYQINVEKDGQSTYVTYIHKTQDPLSAIIPKSEGTQIIVRDVQTNTIILTLNYDEIAQTATKEIPQPTPRIQRNIAKEAMRLTIGQIESKLLSLFGKKATTEATSLKNQIIAKLPYNSQEFIIEYSRSLDTFSIAVTPPVAANIQKATHWFTENGLKDICQVNINWFTPRYLGGTIDQKDLPNCQ